MDEKKQDKPSFLTKLSKFIMKLVMFPIKLIMNLARMINEIRVFVISLITIIVVSVIALLVIYIFKPEPVWGGLKNFLNSDLNKSTVANVSLDDIYKKINTATKSEDGNYYVELNSAEVTTLFRKTALISDASIVELENDRIEFFLNSESNEKPLWFKVRMDRKSEKDMEVTNVGFQRFSLPWFVAGMFDQTFGGLSGMLSKQNTNGDAVIIFNQILNFERFDNKLELEDVELKENKVVLIFED